MNNKSASVSTASFGFDSLLVAPLASVDANALEAACVYYYAVAREHAQLRTPQTAQRLEDAKKKVKWVCRLYNIRQELEVYYTAPNFDAFFHLGLIPQKKVKCGILHVAVNSAVKKPSVTAWLNAYMRSGIEVPHKAAYQIALQRFVTLLQDNVNARICGIGKAPTKKELADGLTAIARACDLTLPRGEPLVMPANAALAIAYTMCRIDPRDIRGLKVATAKEVEEQVTDAIAEQLLRIK